MGYIDTLTVWGQRHFESRDENIPECDFCGEEADAFWSSGKENASIYICNTCAQDILFDLAFEAFITSQTIGAPFSFAHTQKGTEPKEVIKYKKALEKYITQLNERFMNAYELKKTGDEELLENLMKELKISGSDE